MFEVGEAHLTDLAGHQTFRAWDGAKHDYYELMQFTGLKDKKGADIYEGDILRDRGMCFEVFFRDDGDGFWKRDVGKITLIEPIWADSSEVVGNIYENSDLLKQPS